MCIILSFLKSIQERAKLHILLLRQDEYCPTMEEKEALSFCPEYNNAQESHARHFFRFIIVILVLFFFFAGLRFVENQEGLLPWQRDVTTSPLYAHGRLRSSWKSKQEWIRKQ